MILKKKLIIWTVFLFLLAFTPILLAQTPVTAIDTLHLAFWPDYDEPAVLVLMTGSLPQDAQLPAEVTVPIPENADINAVARINSDIGMADIDFQVDGDKLTFVTSDPQFRVEYYAPYSVDGQVHSFDFAWESDLDVGELTAEIQQPSSAESLQIDPQAANAVTNPSDGLVYHSIAPETVPAGTRFDLVFRYNVSEAGLTAGQRAPGPQTNTLPANNTSNPESNINWVTVLVGLTLLVLVAVITWFAATKFSGNSGSRKPRKSQKPPKPSPRARNNEPRSQFCHQCGTKAEVGDRFCRNCGAELK